MLLGKQIRAARVLLEWSQIELAAKSKVAIGTIRRMEASGGPIVAYTTTLAKVQTAMENAGIEFLTGDEPGIRIRTVAKETPKPHTRKA